MKMKVQSDRLFAIGDIHGQFEELILLLQQLPLVASSTLVFLGDYVDRGLQSKEVIQKIIDLQGSYNVITLLGNHEQMFLNYLQDPLCGIGSSFLQNGGTATLASYSTELGDYEVLPEHKRFLQSLRLSYQTKDYFFVHAGVPKIPLKDLDEEKHKAEMLWIRERFLVGNYSWEKIIVHGHTPTIEVEITPNRINLDTGCVYGNRLSAIGLPSNTVYSVPSKGWKKISFDKILGQPHFEKMKNCENNLISIFRGSSIQKLQYVQVTSSTLTLKNPLDPHEQCLFQGEIIFAGIKNHLSPFETIKFYACVLHVDFKIDGFYYLIGFKENPFDSLYI